MSSAHGLRAKGILVTGAASGIGRATAERLLAEGVPVAQVLSEYTEAVNSGRVVVAFNAQFDTKVLRGELRRAGIDDRFEKTPNICTMRASTDICRLPGKRGYKFPKLAEACTHFNIKQEAQHTSLDDARACAEILRRLVAAGNCPDPIVHFAKEKPCVSSPSAFRT